MIPFGIEGQVFQAKHRVHPGAAADALDAESLAS